MSTTSTTENSGMSDADLAATIHEVGQRMLDTAFETSPVARDAPVPTGELRSRFGSHFDLDPEHGRIVAYDAPRGTDGRLPILSNGKPADFNTALAAVMAEDADMVAAMRDRVTFGNTFGVSRIAAAWAHRQNPQGSPQDGTTPPAAATAPATPETPSGAVLRDTAISRMKGALAAGNGPRRIGIY